MAGKMKDYLSADTADYNYTFVVPPSNIMVESGDKNQIIHEFDDGSISVVSKSTDSYFNVELEFALLTQVNAQTIIDLWHKTTYANGRERTFYWPHPIELDTYVVRFMDIIKRTSRTHQGIFTDVSGVIFRVEAFKT